MAIIEVKHLHKVFGDLEVLKDISFNVEEGEVICLIGPSGSGKSTLLRCLNKLEEKQDGDIVILGENISEIKKINQFRENIGMVFQHFNLFPNYTVLQNMTLAPTMLKKMSKAEAVKKAEQLLDRVGLLDKKDVYPVTLIRWSETACGNCPCACNERLCCLMSLPVHWIRRWLEKFWML